MLAFVSCVPAAQTLPSWTSMSSSSHWGLSIATPPVAWLFPQATSCVPLEISRSVWRSQVLGQLRTSVDWISTRALVSESCSLAGDSGIYLWGSPCGCRSWRLRHLRSYHRFPSGPVSTPLQVLTFRWRAGHVVVVGSILSDCSSWFICWRLASWITALVFLASSQRLGP